MDTHTTPKTPTRAGQAVRNLRTGMLGITTDGPMARSPRIGVQWIGGPYPVLMQLAEIERVDIQEGLA